ncbi:cystatin C (amyloid angiopathy and cerebral hemorrhage) [Eucyclogobius newberryi]|uniref:cystatin C (amyloid angiopathy and cerebral hemorrhage) n=1 Tax=Eucyclogobius newberryi TaxID=166745 RepID=UPI003B5A9EE6
MKLITVTILALLVAGAYSAMPGGLRDVDVEDAGMRNALDMAVNKHNLAKNDMFRNDVVEVVRAQSQVVAGVKYIITVKMARTNCRKNKTNEVCHPTAEPYQCTFTVWSRPWMNEIQELDEKCS